MLQVLDDWAVTTPLNAWVVNWNWTWVILEILHFFGLSMLLGGLLVVDLRYIGFLKNIQPSAIRKIIVIVFIGFGINLITGILFFFGDPGRYAINIGFQIKMALIILAGLNAMLFYYKIDSQIDRWRDADTPPKLAKFIACTSLALWFSVLICGRLIPYVGTG
jgi:hypothetical protein